MKLLTLTLMILLASACGQKKEKAPITPTGGTPRAGSAEFASYKAEFDSRLSDSVNGSYTTASIPVTFSLSLPSNVLGRCTTPSPRISINQTLWDQLSASSREELIFHELGHCALNLPHNNTASGGFPVSLMNSIHLGPSIYTRSTPAYRAYMTELFSDTNNTFAALTFDPSNYASMINPDYEYASTMQAEDEDEIPMADVEHTDCYVHGHAN